MIDWTPLSTLHLNSKQLIKLWTANHHLLPHQQDSTASTQFKKEGFNLSTPILDNSGISHTKPQILFIGLTTTTSDPHLSPKEDPKGTTLISPAHKTSTETIDLVSLLSITTLDFSTTTTPSETKDNRTHTKDHVHLIHQDIPNKYADQHHQDHLHQDETTINKTIENSIKYIASMKFTRSSND